MESPKIAAKQPKEVQLEAGKIYSWCACGQSSNQPFCDGSHKSTDLKPVVYKATETKSAWLCQCKHTSDQPFCDGTHKTL